MAQDRGTVSMAAAAAQQIVLGPAVEWWPLAFGYWVQVVYFYSTSLLGTLDWGIRQTSAVTVDRRCYL